MRGQPRGDDPDLIDLAGRQVRADIPARPGAASERRARPLFELVGRRERAPVDQPPADQPEGVEAPIGRVL
jgi:hypothetical protein